MFAFMMTPVDRDSRGALAGPDSKAVPTPGAAGKSPLRPDDGRLLRGRKSRERIRKAARELFRERGFDGATLRAIAERAGMGASSIYRHVRSKEELLIAELASLQEEAWRRFRANDDRSLSTRQRVTRFLDVQHELLAADPDFTVIAVRSTTKPEARVARQVLSLNDRTIGLLMEILQMGRMRKDLAREVDVLEAARVLFNITQGARISWANGMVDDETCRSAIEKGVELLFRGLEEREAGA
jgi:AcrR family transcriptional regulator